MCELKETTGLPMFSLKELLWAPASRLEMLLSREKKRRLLPPAQGRPTAGCGRDAVDVVVGT